MRWSPSDRRTPTWSSLDCQTAMPTAAVAFAKAFPERFIDLGIAEQNAVSFAAGLARMGFVPIVPLFACFSSRRALDQVTIQAAYAELNVKVCGLYAGLTSPNTGATHQMVSDLADHALHSEPDGRGAGGRLGDEPGAGCRRPAPRPGVLSPGAGRHRRTVSPRVARRLCVPARQGHPASRGDGRHPDRLRLDGLALPPGGRDPGERRASRRM